MTIYLLFNNDGMEGAFEDGQLAKKICKENYDKAKKEAVIEQGYAGALARSYWHIHEATLIKQEKEIIKLKGRIIRESDSYITIRLKNDGRILDIPKNDFDKEQK